MVITSLCILVCSLSLFAAQPALSDATIIRIAVQPHSGGNKDINSGLLFDGDTTTGYSWRFYPPALFLIDLGAEKTFSGVSLYALGGANPYRLPFYKVFAGVKEDKLYKIAENHDRDNLPIFSGRSVTYKLTSEFSGIKARYLMFDIRPLSFSHSITEIELIECDEAAVSRDFQGEATSSSSSYDEYYEKAFLGDVRPYPTEDYVTPHIKWVKPFAGKRIKTLFIISHPTSRDIIEIAQRAEIDWQMEVAALNYKQVSVPIDPYIIRRLEKALSEEWDLLVMGATRWKELPESMQTGIIEKVKGGMGLLYIQPQFTTDNIESIIEKLSPAPELLAGIPLELIQFLDRPADPYILKGQLGKGRVVVMRYQEQKETDWWALPGDDWWWSGSTMLPPIDPPDHEPNQSGEYIMAAIIRAMFAAAGRDLVVPNLSIIDQYGNSTVQISFDKEIKGKYLIETAVYDASMRLIQNLGRVPLLEGKTSLWLTKDLPYGANTVNCWIRDAQGRIAGWASQVLNVDNTHIESLDVEEKPRKVGEPIQGVLRIKKGEKPVIKCAIQLVDNYGRVASEYISSEKDQKLQHNFSLSTDRVISQGVRVVAKIYARSQHGPVSRRGPFLIDQKEVYVPLLTEPDENEFIITAWGEYPFLILRPYGFHIWKQAENLGLNGSLAHLNYWPRDVKSNNKKQWDVFLKPFVKFNMRPGVIYPAVKYAVHPNKETIKLAEDSFYKTFADELKYTASIVKRWNVIDFLYGDETRYFEDRSPEMLALFREHLKKEYKSLDALNHSWNTGFKTWDEVEPKSYSVAAKKGNIGSFIKFRTFLEDMMLKYYKTGQAAIREIVPGARTGLSGTYEAGELGNDWSKALKYLNYVIYYFDNGAGRLSREALRAFGSPGSKFFMWTGYDFERTNEVYTRYGAWIDLLLGYDGVGIFSTSSFRRPSYQNMGVISHDFSLTRTGRWFKEELDEIKSGIGRLLNTSRSLSSPIGIYYSVESMSGGAVEWMKRSPSGFRGAVSRAVNSAFRLFQDLQYRPFFVDRNQLFSGRTLTDMNVLVLPAQFLLSDEEIASVKKFVRGGGALICMGHPGYMNLRGELRKDYPLEDLLGSKPGQTFWNRPARVTKFTVGDCSSEIIIADAETQLLNRTTIMLKTADGIPLITKSSYGKGAAYFINGFTNEYEGYRPDITGDKDLDPNSFKESNARAFRNLIDTCLTDIGIKPEFTVSSSTYRESPVPYIENLRFSNGEVLFNCFIERFIPHQKWHMTTISRTISESDYRPLDVKLEKKAHVYNVRKKQYLGYTDKITLPVAPCIANVIALSPKKVEEITVSADCNANRDVIIKVDLKGLEGTGFKPVAHVELYDPDDKEVKHYSKNIVLNDKTLSGKLMIKHALNDPKGTWKIKATDVLSGKDVVTSYELK